MTLLEPNHQMPAAPSPAEHSAGEVAPLPASPARPLLALQLFREQKMDTYEIAKRLGITEAKASRWIYVARTHELGFRVSTKPNERWGRR